MALWSNERIERCCRLGQESPLPRQCLSYTPASPAQALHNHNVRCANPKVRSSSEIWMAIVATIAASTV